MDPEIKTFIGDFVDANLRKNLELLKNYADEMSEILDAMSKSLESIKDNIRQKKFSPKDIEMQIHVHEFLKGAIGEKIEGAMAPFLCLQKVEEISEFLVPGYISKYMEDLDMDELLPEEPIPEDFSLIEEFDKFNSESGPNNKPIIYPALRIGAWYLQIVGEKGEEILPVISEILKELHEYESK